MRVEEVSGDTSQANAYAFGLGPSRKVVLWDTLLDGRFSDGAERVVLAHEIGHHSSRHLAKALGWFALFALPGAWMLMRLTRSRGGMGEPAAVPLALFVVAVLQLVAAPAQNAISRRMESEADWKALAVDARPRVGARALRRVRPHLARRPGPAGLAAAPARHPSHARRPRRDGGRLGSVTGAETVGAARRATACQHRIAGPVVGTDRSRPE